MNRIYLVRHAENVANITKEFSSKKVDYSLTEKGILQAQQTGAWFADKHIHTIYASPLKRTRETAEWIGKSTGAPVEILEEVREILIGDLEDRPVSKENWAEFFDVLHDWENGCPQRRFPNGENYLELCARFLAGIRKVTAGKQDQNLVIVSHAGVLAYTLSALLPEADPALAADKKYPNCAISELILEDAGEKGAFRGKVVRWASFSHLSGEASKLISGVLKD